MQLDKKEAQLRALCSGAEFVIYKTAPWLANDNMEHLEALVCMKRNGMHMAQAMVSLKNMISISGVTMATVEEMTEFICKRNKGLRP